MKKHMFKLSFFLLISFFMISCAPGSDTQAVDSLTTFYKGYIQENSKMPVDNAKIEALKSTHCTARYIAELADAELEADPFLNAQDVEEKWAENLEVTAEASAKDKFNVCYTASFDNAKHCVKVTMVEDGGSWKIDQVAN